MNMPVTEVLGPPSPTIVTDPAITRGEVTALAVIPIPDPPPADTVTHDIAPERIWDNIEVMCLVTVILKWSSIAGIAGILGVYVGWPIVTFLSALVAFVSTLGSVAALIPVGVVLLGMYWATSLLGFWDHVRPMRSRPTASAPAPVQVADAVAHDPTRTARIGPKSTAAHDPQPAPKSAQRTRRDEAAAEPRQRTTRPSRAPKPPKLTPRQEAVRTLANALRGATQGRHSYICADGSRCARQVGWDTLGEEGLWNTLGTVETDKIERMNDVQGRSFEYIADYLERKHGGRR